ncbi:hypothetical protein [Flavobacterium denitrificans]|uniref:hypothetical protein n=1 Tax=Flavobacterium denitrificans TaxID=281361 RepID=UPI00047BFF39|nr:hypothetical protein [Flavobacterium denitrificans]
MKFFLIMMLFILILSCHQKENKNAISNSDSIHLKKNMENKREEIKEENKQIGDTIFMNFKNEKDRYTAEGHINSIHSKIYVKFINEHIGKLNATIFPSIARENIRFNQIIFPDKTMDGPFGKELKIDIKQKGIYVLVIGHSQMAEDPFIGKFTIQLENKRQ